jgi:HK97 family phage major capsid protein
VANYVPLSGAANASGGYVLPAEQGEILTNGILQEAGAIAIAGDRRATSSRATTFPVWLGAPTAGPVGEGAAKPPTGAEFGQASLAVKKFASYVIFTDEMLEDLQNGDVNVLVDSGVRNAIQDSIDANAIGLDSGSAISGVFDSELVNTTQGVELTDDADGLEKAISAALGQLEANGYGRPSDQAVLLGFGFQQAIRDARGAVGSDATTERLYGAGRDPFYGRQVEFSTNLNAANESGVGKVVGFVVHKPNIHVRVRKDIEVRTSTEATVSDGSTDRNAFEENLTVIRYETRLAFMVHDLDRAVVAIENTLSS